MQDYFVLGSCCLLLRNTKDLTKILGENGEYFIRIISFEGMYPQRSAYGDVHSLNASSSLALHAEILLSVFGSHKSNSEFFSTMGLLLQDHYLFLSSHELSLHENKLV